MALEMKKTSRWWYARLQSNGKLRRFPLVETKDGKQHRIAIEGRRPRSLKHPQEGDAKFLDSYRRALAAHDRLREEELSKKSVEDFAQRLIESKTGARQEFVEIEDIAEAWAAIPRKREPSEQYLQTNKAKLQTFTAFMRREYPGVGDLAEVRAVHVRAFMDAEAERGIAPRTWNIMLKLLKTVFRKLEPNADAYRVYLHDAVFKDETTVHREAFKEEEIEAILEAARDHELLYGPLVTALCTAMRRGDCVLLKWSSVNMEADFIEVRTSKTGETAEIPLLPMLREELSRAVNTGSPYVFPQAAKQYLRDPHLFDPRLRAILVKAGFVPKKPAKKGGKRKPAASRPVLPKLPPEELRSRGLEAIAAENVSETKRDRMKAVFIAYLDGKGLPAIASEYGVSKSTVSLDLNAIEQSIGAAVLRRRGPSPAPAVIRGSIHEEADGGTRLRQGSIRGWHSFRVSFVTRALARGMPEELVRRVTGHTAVDVVRRHYFKPAREDFRREFEKAMPQMTKDGAKSRDEQMREILQSMAPKTWKADKKKLLALLDTNA